MKKDWVNQIEIKPILIRKISTKFFIPSDYAEKDFIRISLYFSPIKNTNTKYSETAYLWSNRFNRNAADFCTFRCIVWIYLIMFALRCRHYAITHGLQRLFTTALFARHPFQRFASTTSKPTEQLDIDKKNGVLAYIPFGSDFELSPIMGKMEFTTRITNR